MTLVDKATALGRLHHGREPLLLANAWDGASARLLQAMGFPAIATSSAGVAAARGYRDGAIPPREMLDAAASIARCVDIPVSADVEDAYVEFSDVRRFVDDVVRAGIAGINVEDVRRGAADLVPRSEQVERIRAIRAAADAIGMPLVINARTDVYLRRIGDPADRERLTIDRLNAYRDAGADCLFAPGVTDAESIARLVASIRGPLNVLATAATPPLDVLAKLGVARVSLGSGPMRVALTSFRDFLGRLRSDGAFDTLGGALTYDELNEMMP